MPSPLSNFLIFFALLATTRVSTGSSEFQNLKVPASEFVGSVRSTIGVIRQVIPIVSQFAGAFGDFRLSNTVSDCLDLMDLSVDHLTSTLSASQIPIKEGTHEERRQHQLEKCPRLPTMAETLAYFATVVLGQSDIAPGPQPIRVGGFAVAVIGRLGDAIFFVGSIPQ